MNPVKFDKLLKFLKKERIDASELDLSSVIGEIGFVTLPLLGDPATVDQIELMDIYYAVRNKPNIIEVRTGEQIYSHDNKRFDLMQILSEKGFILLDKNLLVNLQMVKWYHSQLQKIYFTEDYESKDAISIRVIGTSIPFIQKQLTSARDIYQKPKIFSAGQANRILH